MLITVTKPFLPPISDFQAEVEKIWKNHWVTNHGPLVLQFEKEISEYLKLSQAQFVANGTIALQIAYHALELKGEVITTPFSFIATSSSLFWEHCKPVFADIDPNSFNIDPENIEDKITAETSAILATHVYGNPCEIEKIDAIAKKNNLKVIYDAAHCFGVRYKQKSVLEYGNVSMLSLHATKMFHSTEGGLLITPDKQLHSKMWHLKNFGFEAEELITSPGINGKNCEFHAAMGLCNLRYANDILERYKLSFSTYLERLSDLKDISFQKINPDSGYNCAYFPVLFKNEEQAVSVKQNLMKENIYSRRYFYPSLNTVNYLSGQKCENAESVSRRILCLPMSYYLLPTDINKISQIIINTL